MYHFKGGENSKAEINRFTYAQVCSTPSDVTEQWQPSR